LIDAATSFLLIVNKSATMASQGCGVQMEQSDMRLALNMAKMHKRGSLRTTMGEMQYLMKTPYARVKEGKK